MKSFLHGCGFLALLFASNAIAAGVMWAVAKAIAFLFPALDNTLWPGFIAGIIGVAVAVTLLIFTIRLISGLRPQNRARAPG